MHPKKFALWLFMVSAAMLFAAWTSAYIVKKGDPGWVEIQVPQQFWISSIVIVMSSVAMILAQRAVKRDHMKTATAALWITTLFGVIFLVSQIMCWRILVEMNESLIGGDVSYAFIWVFTIFHALHIVSGIIVLLFLLAATINRRVSSQNMIQMEMSASYWHFLGGLWLYLFFFLLLNP